MPAITFEHVSKAYRRHWGRGSLREALPQLFGQVVGRRRPDDADLLWALRDLSFTVEEGETLGLIGPNGAGKTTTLKLLSRVIRPTSGRIEVRGRLSALIELGAGFHPDLTGRENVYLNGTILGLSRREIERKFDAIVAFAELEDFIDMPVKRYSSGMFVRLGFAVAVHVDPDVLLVDEVLAVGDYRFRDKCIEKINEFRRRGKTMVVVSHSKEMIQRLCNRVLFINHGQAVFMGETRKALELYHSGFVSEELRRRGQVGRAQGKAIAITEVEMLDAQGRPARAFRSGAPATVRIRYRVADEPIESPMFYCRVRRGYQILHSATTARVGLSRTFPAGEEGIIEVHYEALNLLEGEYGLNVGIARDQFSPILYDSHDDVLRFEVHSFLHEGGGFVRLPHRWQLGEESG